VCPSGYTGPLCTEIVNQCNQNPCLNGATCYPQLNGYTCLCATGWTGLQCDIRIDFCYSTPCKNNGQCTSLINAWSCTCLYPFTSFDCSYNSACDANPCFNQALCVTKSASPFFTCTCPPGYSGTRCELRNNPCASNPCNNGVCQDSATSFTCSCFAGYTGVVCNLQIDYCSSNPCKNGATCVSTPGSYSCNCPTGKNSIKT
jgi:hypothetical protein